MVQDDDQVGGRANAPLTRGKAAAERGGAAAAGATTTSGRAKASAAGGRASTASPKAPAESGKAVAATARASVAGGNAAATTTKAAGGGRNAAGGARGSSATSRRRRQAAPARSAAKARPAPPAAPLRIGVISDTHGYLDPTVTDLFRGVAHIIHAGDVGDPAILESLQAVAPVTAVSGNVESGETSNLPREVIGEVAGVRFVVAHKPKRLLKRLSTGRIHVGPKGALPDLVVFGHVHVPSVSWVDGTLYLNPGTASSPDEEDDGPTVVLVEVETAGLSVRFVPLVRRLDDEGAPLVTRAR